MKRTEIIRYDRPERRGLRLALLLSALVLLLFLGWWSEGFPLFSEKREFHRFVVNAMVNDAELETIRDGNGWISTLYVGTNDHASYVISEDGSGPRGPTYIGDVPLVGVMEYPTIDGIYYALFHSWCRYDHELMKPDYLTACGTIAAIKTEGLRAELSLVLGNGPRWESNTDTIYPGGSFPLMREEERDGWTYFSLDLSVFDEVVIENEVTGKNEYATEEDLWYSCGYSSSSNPAITYFNWLQAYYQIRWRNYQSIKERESHFHLTLYDAENQVVKEIDIPACES